MPPAHAVSKPLVQFDGRITRLLLDFGRGVVIPAAVAMLTMAFAHQSHTDAEHERVSLIQQQVQHLAETMDKMERRQDERDTRDADRWHELHEWIVNHK